MGVDPVFFVPLSLLAAATVIDVRRREIPDGVSIALFAWAVGVTAIGPASGWMPLLAGLGLGATLGVGLFSLGGFGGGDAKVLAAIGALLGPRDFVAFLAYVAMEGGVLALFALVRGRRDVAYAPAMALGFLTFVLTRHTP